MECSIQKVVEMGYDAVGIFGSQVSYVSQGFECCKRYKVRAENGRYPSYCIIGLRIPGRFPS